MAGFLHMLAFRPLVGRRRLSGDCAGDDDDSLRADPRATAAAALGVGGGRGVVRDARRRGRLPVRAGRADRAAARGVRLVARTDRLRGLAQPHALRPDLALRGGPDGPLRRPAGRHVRAADGRRRQRPDGLHDRAVAAHPVLGPARRHRHRLDVDGLRRHDHQPLVRRPPRAGQRHPHRRQRHRPADLPAGGGLAGHPPRLAYGGTAGRRGRPRRRTAGAAAPPQPPGRPRAAGVRRDRRRPRPAAPPARRLERGARPRGAARRRPQPDLLAARPAGSPSAG